MYIVAYIAYCILDKMYIIFYVFCSVLLLKDVLFDILLHIIEFLNLTIVLHVKVKAQNIYTDYANLGISDIS